MLTQDSPITINLLCIVSKVLVMSYANVTVDFHLISANPSINTSINKYQAKEAVYPRIYLLGLIDA